MLKSIISKIFVWHDQHQGLTHAALIVLVGILVYGGTLHAPFRFDDLPCIVENPLIRNFSTLFNLDNYREFGLAEDIRNNMVTRFVAYFTFALNYRLHEFSLPGFHLFNIAIHLLNAVLVYLLFRLTIARSAIAPANGQKREWIALIVALLFVAHPVQTNAVTYIVQRFSLLATFFYLLALVAYIKAAAAATRNGHRTFYAVSIAATILAMYTKEISFTLPVMITLYDVAFLDGDFRIRLRRLTPILATLILIPATVLTLSALSARTGNSVGNPLDLATLSGQAVSRWDYFITQWRVITTYLRLLIIPVDLNFDYDYPIYTSLLQAPVFLSGLLVTALSLTGGCLLFRHRFDKSVDPGLRLVGFGLVWFFLTLVMESSIIRLDDIIFEYRLYLPAIGFIGAAVALADWGIKRLDASVYQGWGRPASILISVALVGSLGVATIRRNNVWNDAVLFWQDTIEKSPNKARPLGNLANEYAQQGRFTEALLLFKKSKTLDPNSWIPPYQLAQIYLALNQPAAAIAELTQAIQFNQNLFFIWRVLGFAYLQQGLLQQAADAYQQVMMLKPGDPEAALALEQLRERDIYPEPPGSCAGDSAG